jgi:general secretion pathway protein M
MSMAVRSSLRRVLALLGYGAVFLCLTSVAGVALADILDRMNAVTNAREILDRLDGRKKPLAATESGAETVVNGSPFLEGPTVTVAGAALQERVGVAVKKAGGNVLSSQIELDGPQAASGYVDLSEIFEIDQASLQPLLYDLEAGMPFLFVDTLVVQAPQALGQAEGGRMRVQIGVSGQWQATR